MERYIDKSNIAPILNKIDSKMNNRYTKGEIDEIVEAISGGESIRPSYDANTSTIVFTKLDIVPAGGGGGIVISDTPPQNTNMLWIDISEGNDKGVAKYYIDDEWVSVSSVWG